MHIVDKFGMVVVDKWALIVANIEARVAYIEANMVVIDRMMGMMATGNTSLV